MTFTIEDKPADIVKVFPRASDLFKEHKIDFCCGGNVPLKEFVMKNSLDEASILTELNTRFEDWNRQNHEVVDWDQKPLSEIVDHISNSYHTPLMEELPTLGQFVTKVYSRHGGTHEELQKLYHVYNTFKVTMVEHTIKEENEVFPLIKQYEQEPTEDLLQRIRELNGDLEEEHQTVGDLLKEMSEITGEYNPPADACSSYQITYARLAELVDNTLQHIHLENHILFARL